MKTATSMMLMLAGVVAGDAWACDATIAAAPHTVVSAGVHCLAGDVTVNEAYGIGIASGDVTLDCRGYKLRGTRTGGVGIYRAGNGNNLKVQNCDIEGFGNGISLSGLNAKVLNNTIRSSGPRAITVSGEGAELVGNRVLSVSAGVNGWIEAVTVTDANRAVVMDNVITGVGGASSLLGLFVYGSSDVEIIGNKILDMTYAPPASPENQDRAAAVGISMSSVARLAHNTIMMRGPKVKAFHGLPKGACVDNLVIGTTNADFSACASSAGNVYVP